MITLHCSQPNEIKITVTVELTLGEWRKMYSLISKTPEYYQPLHDIGANIINAIREIEKREVIKQGESQ